MTDLERTLQEKDAELFARYLDLQRLAEQVMPFSRMTFWNYTDHGPDHFHHVIEMVDLLLVSDVRESLSVEELFALLAGATWHDLGMVTEQPLAAEEAEHIRETHQELGADRIRESPDTYGIPEIYKGAVAEIVRHHRVSQIAEEVEPVPVRRCRIRLPLLCALVRAGDELDLLERAPDIVALTLDLSEESRRHFRLGRSVVGVVPDRQCGTVDVNAHADDEETADALTKLVAKINGELLSMREILADHGLPEYQAELKLDQAPIVKRRIAIELADVSTVAEELVQLTGFDQVAVNSALAALRGSRLADTRDLPSGPCLWHLRMDKEVHEKIAEDVFPTSYATRFVRSGFNRAMVEEVVWDDLLLTFSAHFKEPEAELRKQILCSSPRALRAALFSSEVPRERNPLCRSVILDEALLLGLTSDIYLQPEISVDIDVPRALRSLSRNVRKAAPPLGQIVARAWEYRDRSPQEMADLYMDKYAGPPMPGATTKIDMKMTFAAEPAYLSPMHMLMAASEEEVPYELAPPQLTSVEVESSAIEQRGQEGSSGSWVQITPKRTPPPVPYWRPAAALSWDDDKNALVVNVDVASSYNKEFPDRVELKLIDPSTGRIDISFLEAASCDHTLRALEDYRDVLARLKAADVPLIVLINGETSETIGEALLSPDQVAEFVLPERPEWVDVLLDMAEAAGETVWLPFVYGVPFNEKAEAVLRSTTQDDRHTSFIDLLEGVEEKPDVTLVRMIVRDHSGRRTMDEHAGSVGGVVSIEGFEGTREAIQAVERWDGCRKERLETSYWRPETPRDLVQQIRDALADGTLHVPGWAAGSSPPLPSYVRLTFEPVRETPWERIHEVVIDVHAEPEEWRRYSEALQAAELDDDLLAVERLERLVADVPLFSEAHCSLGSMRMQMGDPHGARSAFDNALITLEARQDRDSAPKVRALTSAVKAATVLDLSYLHAQMRNPEKAVAYLQEVPPDYIMLHQDEIRDELSVRRADGRLSRENCALMVDALREQVPDWEQPEQECPEE